MITSIGQIAVNVKDLDRAVEFYRDILKLEFLFQVPGMAFFQVGHVRLMLAVPTEPGFDHPASILYFVSTSIDDEVRRLRQLGVKFESDLHKVADLGTTQVWMAFFRDSEHNVAALMEERRTA